LEATSLKVRSDGADGFYPVWVIIGGIAASGSYWFALRDPYATSWMKIGFASLLLIAYCLLLVFPTILSERYVGMWGVIPLYLFYWPMRFLGNAICVGAILGTSIGMVRRQVGEG
jgi:hypothetical protein